jgi:hypothetical protein
MRTYELALIPGLLQTEAYARAVFAGEPGALPEEVDKSVKARLQRQLIIDGPTPPALFFILDESVVLRKIGGRDVMREQLLHLLAMMERPCVTVRIIPLSSGSTAGLIGPFVIADDDDSHAAFLENAETGEVIHQADMIRKLNERWELLSGLAQPTYVSRQIIQRAMESHDR